MSKALDGEIIKTPGTFSENPTYWHGLYGPTIPSGSAKEQQALWEQNGRRRQVTRISALEEAHLSLMSEARK
jgi:hypothetical protein